MKKTKEDLNNEIADLKKQLEEANNNYLRALADYQNLQKHSANAISIAKESAKIDMLNAIKPYIDGTVAANENGEQSVLYKCMLNSLQKAGFIPYGEVGDEFDPSIYNAVSMVKTGTVESKHIASVLNKGWALENGKVAIYCNVLVEE